MHGIWKLFSLDWMYFHNMSKHRCACARGMHDSRYKYGPDMQGATCYTFARRVPNHVTILIPWNWQNWFKPVGADWRCHSGVMFHKVCIHVNGRYCLIGLRYRTFLSKIWQYLLYILNMLSNNMQILYPSALTRMILKHEWSYVHVVMKKSWPLIFIVFHSITNYIRLFMTLLIFTALWTLNRLGFFIQMLWSCNSDTKNNIRLIMYICGIYLIK